MFALPKIAKDARVLVCERRGTLGFGALDATMPPTTVSFPLDDDECEDKEVGAVLGVVVTRLCPTIEDDDDVNDVNDCRSPFAIGSTTLPSSASSSSTSSRRECFFFKGSRRRLVVAAAGGSMLFLFLERVVDIYVTSGRMSSSSIFDICNPNTLVLSRSFDPLNEGIS